MSRVLVPLAEGFEEIEAVTVIDLLRRARIDVRTAALRTRTVTGSHGITIQADTELGKLPSEVFDMVVLPGGMPGARHLAEDARIAELLRRHAGEGRITAAICAAPMVLAQAGVLDQHEATSFPGFLREDSAPGLRISTSPVVVDGKVVTSRGPGTAIDFSLALIELLEGRAARDEVEARLQRA